MRMGIYFEWEWGVREHINFEFEITYKYNNIHQYCYKTVKLLTNKMGEMDISFGSTDFHTDLILML